MDPLRPRPPHVRFVRQTLEYKDPLGQVQYRDADFVEVTPVGSKDTVVREFKDWIASQEQLVQHERQNPEWVRQWKAAFAAWKAGEELPVNGTPLKMCPAFTGAELRRALDAGILTIEDLAAANSEATGRLGMGGVSMVQRAKDWMKAQTGMAPLVSQLDASRTLNEQLMNQVREQGERIAQLEATLKAIQGQQQYGGPAGAPAWTPPQERLTIQSDRDGDLVDSAIDEAIG